MDLRSPARFFIVSALTLLLLACKGGRPAPEPTPTLAPTLASAPTQPPATLTVEEVGKPTVTLEPVTASPTPQTSLATATRAPSYLAWDALKNAAYPLEWPKGGVAQLTDGIYREKYLPDSATELVIRLADIRSYGDLNGDGNEDTVVILVADPGGSGTFINLMIVLNDNGAPKPVAGVLLGDRVVIRTLVVVEGRIEINMLTHGPEDPMCCPNLDSRRVYTLRQGALQLVSQVDTPREKPLTFPRPEPQRIAFAPGATVVTIEGTVEGNDLKSHVLHASAGQRMMFRLASAHNNVLLSAYGAADGKPLVSILSEAMAWAGEIPSTQDYIINAVSVSGSPTVYTLQVEFVTEVTSSPTPKPTDTPVPTRAPTDTPAPAPAATSGPAAKAKDNVVYLTFDDGPTDPRWTPQVLAVLAQHNAHVTFFVLGQQAEKYPKLIETQVAAGHTVANHTNSHVSLDGISREKFFEEVSATKDVLEERESKCLRPPYGATDAYTRAYAEELGYRIVMWDIDTEDWKRPGAESIAARVLKNVFPGAIILFHDGGGDRAQTVEALATVLNELAKQGYRFEPVC